jgi:hypothetical protein
LDYARRERRTGAKHVRARNAQDGARGEALNRRAAKSPDTPDAAKRLDAPAGRSEYLLLSRPAIEGCLYQKGWTETVTAPDQLQ